MRRIARIAFLIFCIALFTVGILEIVLRAWGYAEHHLYDPIYMPYEGCNDVNYILKPNLRGARGNGNALVNTNELGLRYTAGSLLDSPKRDGEYRIALIGDSATFGAGIEKAEDTFAFIVEGILNSRSENLIFSVFNYAACGYSVKEMAAILRYRMLDCDPDLVLMAVIPQDFALTRTPSVDDWGYLSDNRDFGMGLLNLRGAQFLRKSRLLHSLRYILYCLGHKYKLAENCLGQGRYPESYKYIRQFRDIASAQNISYAIVLLPDLNSSFYGLSQKLNQDNINFLDLEKVRGLFIRDQFMASKFDPHISLLVHKKIGGLLSDYILDEFIKRQEQSE
ncbi:MAG: hypothetical protein JW734_05045 [Candidatus Omnitrophica bacterium]|nr:hypothetical protein [Candidatus Omnitrophota bacterium]